VPADVVERYGVVSAECARAMAVGCRDATGATYALTTTGVAGPDPQEDQPVGLVFVGLAGPDGVSAVTMELPGDRHQIQDRACREALSALCGNLRGEQPPLG
jgi:PncC family amidohydrolase